MEKENTLVKLTEDISEKLLDSKYLIEILEEMLEDAKSTTLLSIIKKKIYTAFRENEECRQKIFIAD